MEKREIIDVKGWEKFSKKQKKEIKNLVIERLKQLPDHLKISIG